MAKLDTLFSRYDKLVIFDTETTGLSPNRDEIIEFSAAVLERQNGEAVVTREYDNLVALSPGRFVPPKIQALTGITNQDLRERGIPKPRLCRDVAELIAGERTLLLAYNAHFDLSFLFYTLVKDGDAAILKGKTSWTSSRCTGTGAPFPTVWPQPLRPTTSRTRCKTPTGPLTTCWPLWPSWRPWRQSGMI